MIVDTPECINCGEMGRVEVKSEEWLKWIAPDRPKIQEVFRDYTPEIREQILTGIHPKCWDKMFGEVPV